MYRNAGYIEHIPHIFICAGYRKGGYDSCEGKHLKRKECPQWFRNSDSEDWQLKIFVVSEYTRIMSHTLASAFSKYKY